MYKVLSEFIEDSHHYKKGDDYPFSNEVNQDRVNYLAEKAVNGKVAFIQKIESQQPEEKETADMADQFKGVRSDSMKKALQSAGIEFSETIDRDELIRLMVEKGVTI